MERINGSITETDSNGNVSENFLFTYSEEEKQENEINAVNAKLIFSPEFIPYKIDVKKKYKLTHIETLAYGFISYYLRDCSNTFYFTNEQLSNVLDCSVSTAEKSMAQLARKGLIKSAYKVKAGGGRIRFVRNLLSNQDNSELQKSASLTSRNMTGKENKIKENNIYIPLAKIKDGVNSQPMLSDEQVDNLMSKYNLLSGRKYKTTKAITDLLIERSSTFSYEELLTAISNMLNDSFYKGHNNIGWVATPKWLFSSDERVDELLNKRNRYSSLNPL